MKMLNVALSKGRLTDATAEVFEKAGIDMEGVTEDTRKLIIEQPKANMRFFMVKPSDVPVYVEYGAADLGIVGKDTLLEEAKDLYEVLDLGFSKCRMVVAGPPASKGRLEGYDMMRVGTKYPGVAKRYFEGTKGMQIEVIKLNGSVELACLVGLSEVIVDLVESGRTLKENGLVVLEKIADISARMIVNRVSMKMHSQTINDLIERIKKAL